MPAVQVGGYCYVDASAASPAACAAFVPLSTLDSGGNNLITITCQSANVDGTLLMSKSVVPTSGGTPVVTTFSQSIEYPPCVQGDIIDAVLAVFAVALVAGALIWGARRVLEQFRKYQEA